MRVAIVHHWLVHMGGAEKVVEAFCNLFPEAHLFTHVYVPERVPAAIRSHPVHTSFIQRFPLARRFYKAYLPFMPMALEHLDLRGFDLVISSESGPSKGVIVDPGALHICYCHSPMRYLWDMFQDYREGMGRWKRLLSAPAAHYLRMWDVASAARVDRFVVNSRFVQQRVRKYYRRPSMVIHPPVEVDAFGRGSGKGEFYLMVGRMVPYKRADLAIEAFCKMKRPLVIIGEGEALKGLKKRLCPYITFLGRQPFPILREHYARCRALIFPGVEDFGIVPVEAMASGRPVIAYRRGGVLDTVEEGVTGVFFDEPTPESLIRAVERFESAEEHFVPERIRERARRFDRPIFEKKFMVLVERAMGGMSGPC
ncbi:MAG: glycosyltransferase family 4 protein [Gammaproteobacteria bacterium]|nr:MAG: glycosyltransferase family 4 protein [Gammaproteobacteria bacterium]